MIVGCYSLDLYCDNVLSKDEDLFGGLNGDKHEYREFPKTYTGNTRQEAERQARKEGWMINNKTGICLCPKCSGKR
jgi:hypothetical protein